MRIGDTKFFIAGAATRPPYRRIVCQGRVVAFDDVLTCLWWNLNGRDKTIVFRRTEYLFDSYEAAEAAKIRDSDAMKNEREG